MLAARGTSDRDALYAKYLVETRLGLPCALASMSTMTQPRVEPGCPTAREGALKLMETSYVAAQAFSGEELLHGPVAMVDENLPVVVLAPDGRSGELLRPVLTRLDALRADVRLVGSTRLAQEFRVSSHVPVRSPDEDSLAPLTDIVPLQRRALGMAVDRRLDPETPRGLHKVTLTR